MLWLHVLAGPVFAVGLAVSAVLWADGCQFVRDDPAWLRRGGAYFVRRAAKSRAEADAGMTPPPADRLDAGQKLFFWIIVTLGFLAVASMMFQTVPWFGQRGQARLLAIHKYSALGLLIAVILHTYVVLLAKPGTWRAMVSGTVSAEWARRHHPSWWSRVSKESERKDDS